MKGDWKSEKNMMMNRMAKKPHVGGYACAKASIQSLGRRKGGGVNPSSRELEETGLNGCWDEDFTKVLDHLSPEAGGITLSSITFILIFFTLAQITFGSPCGVCLCFSNMEAR